MENETNKPGNEPATTAAAPKTETHNSNLFPGAFQLFEPSYKLFLGNFKEFATLLAVPFTLSVLLLFNQPHIYEINNHVTVVYGKFAVLAPLIALVSLLIAPGLIVLQLACARMQKISAGDAFRHGLTYIWKLIGLSIILSFALIISFMLFIIPFFIVLPRVILSIYFLIDQNMGIFDSIRASNEAYKKHHGVWGIIGVSFLLNLPALIPFIGRVIATCLGYLYESAFVLRYLQIQSVEAGKQPITPLEAKLKS